MLRLTLEARSVPEVREAMGTIASSNLERMAGFLGEHQANGLLRPDIDAHLLSEVFFSMTSTLVMQRMTFVEPVLPARDEDRIDGRSAHRPAVVGRRPRRGRLMDKTIARAVVVLGGIVAALAALTSAAGVSLRGDLATTEFVTVRGEVVQVVSEGIYRFNAEGIVAEGVGWDLVTLFVIVPATLVSLALMWRGSLRATLVTAGLLAYFCYQSAEYAVFWAYGPLYPAYVATLALSVSALGLLVYGLDADALQRAHRALLPAPRHRRLQHRRDRASWPDCGCRSSRQRSGER